MKRKKLLIASALLVTLVVASSTVILFSAKAQNTSVLNTEELRSITNDLSSVDSLSIYFEHSWGNIVHQRKILINSTGEYVVQDWQNAGALKDMVIAGEKSASDFTEAEYDLLMRDNVDYRRFTKGEIKLSVLSDIIKNTAEVVNDNITMSEITMDFWFSETLHLSIATQENNVLRGIVVIEEVQEDYHDVNKLNLLYDVERLLENAISESNSEEISVDEYEAFKEQYYISSDGAFMEQLKLRHAIKSSS